MTASEMLEQALVAFINLILPLVFYVMGLFKRLKPRRRRERPKDVVIFHHPGRGPWAPSMIPFAVKVETYLRMAKIPYQSIFGLAASPKGKFPWIEHNGKTIGDSTFIIKYLNKEYNINLNSHLNDEERAIARAFRVLGEDHAYWTGAIYRWWLRFDLKLMTESMGIPSRIITWVISKNIKKQAYAQGTGRHTEEEIREFMLDDVKSISDKIGKNKFLMGESPCEEDCGVFGILSQVRWNMPGSGEVRLIEEEYPNLRDYCDRMKELYWPDWDECITFGGTRKPTK